MSDDVRASSAHPPDQIEALQGVIGLCESEANRMKHDPKTADHWRQVARALNELHVNLVMDEAQRNVRHIVEREREAENVSGIMDMRLRASSAHPGDAPRKLLRHDLDQTAPSDTTALREQGWSDLADLIDEVRDGKR